ncbi:hypothetical protein QBC35DRAFT_516758 [Podospora australis]|uniref:NAD-dependent epimerase/dehydratase domain-containing protein n=1 Tax=Podospora australis TaxID=1536484 RepID=A0AAN6WQ44_9PEZI|nr:hypothetical protein QBC35DRAFT_516758 [Podospora australis]
MATASKYSKKAVKPLAVVTGVTGYIGARTAEAQLEAGVFVRGTSRDISTSRVRALIEHFGKRFPGKFEVIQVPDITVPGAFDDVVKDATCIAHLAGPILSALSDGPEPTIHVAVNGTLQILESAHKEDSVENFVYMSSARAIRPHYADKGRTYTESDWNEEAEGYVEFWGAQARGTVVYAASKVAAERALWKFCDERDPRFSVTAINPGHDIFTCAGPDNVQKILVFLDFRDFVDVRDVACLVVFASKPYNRHEVDRKRFVAAPHHCPLRAIARILAYYYPSIMDFAKSPFAGSRREVDRTYTKRNAFKSNESVRLSEEGYIPWEKTLVDTVEAMRSFLQRNQHHV